MDKILPEIHHEFKKLSLAEIERAYENGDTVTGFVIGVSLSEEQMYVQLGDDITATMPFSRQPSTLSATARSGLPN